MTQRHCEPLWHSAIVNRESQKSQICFDNYARTYKTNRPVTKTKYRTSKVNAYAYAYAEEVYEYDHVYAYD